MFVSLRFRDIFGSGPIQTRRTDGVANGDRFEPLSDTKARSGSADVEAIWLEITAAHRRAARTFTPEFIRAANLAGGQS